MIQERLKNLRLLMEKNGVDAYIIPSVDAHNSEYLPKLWQRRAWISGFDGSAGDVVVFADKAGLWTDARYHLQAENQLKNSGIDLFKVGLPEVPSMEVFLRKSLSRGKVVGIDPRLLIHSTAKGLRDELSEAGIDLKLVEENLVDLLWKDQPALPETPIEVWPEQYAGQSVKDKLANIRKEMAELGTKVHVLTMLDAIAWTFNVRSRDVDFNPVAISYAIITDSSAKLFTSPAKVTEDLRGHLGSEIEILAYTDFADALKKECTSGVKVLLDPATVSEWVVDIVSESAKPVYRSSPVTLLRARKNATEVKGFRDCHERDGVAMVKFMNWLEDAVPTGKVTEIKAAKQLEAFRAEDPLFRGPSFETISAYADHAAIVHYGPTPEIEHALKPEGIYLIDSGGQYLDGTTDITRTITLGKTTSEQKDRFTRVLKGHIQIALSRFPEGTRGIQLDVLARKALWSNGLDYGHGTGHGVGSYLCVHEGPQSIAFSKGLGAPLEPGMIISNEPGFYKAGEYGIRIETLVVVTKDEDFSSEAKPFYRFETATLCPIDLRLIEKNLMTEEEVEYLNYYHRRVRQKLSPHLGGKDLDWLQKATAAI